MTGREISELRHAAELHGDWPVQSIPAIRHRSQKIADRPDFSRFSPASGSAKTTTSFHFNAKIPGDALRTRCPYSDTAYKADAGRFLQVKIPVAGN
jgi:hypothetical protein